MENSVGIFHQNFYWFKNAEKIEKIPTGLEIARNRQYMQEIKKIWLARKFQKIPKKFPWAGNCQKLQNMSNGPYQMGKHKGQEGEAYISNNTDSEKFTKKEVLMADISKSCDWPKKDIFDGLHKQLKSGFGVYLLKKKFPF